jgi:hypothetical protein
MEKSRELSDPKSCLNRARPDEMVFVLLERDFAAPEAIEQWARVRVHLNLNQPNDPQIKEALEAAAEMRRRQDTKPTPSFAPIG